MRLRKGFGTVRKLTGNRRNPYAVHPPKVNGVRPKAICYVNDYHIGVCVLNAWHNGKYYAGMELDLKEKKPDEMLYGGSSTFQEAYDLYWEHRFGESAVRELDPSSQAATRSAWKRLEDFWNRNMDEVTIMELQSAVNETAKEYSKTTVTRVIGLIRGMYRFALPRELCRKDVGMYIEMPKTKEEEHHDSFTDGEIEKLWAASGAHSSDGDAAAVTQESSGVPDASGAADINGAAVVSSGIGSRDGAVPSPDIGAEGVRNEEDGSAGIGSTDRRTGRVTEEGGEVDTQTVATVRMILTMIYSGFRISAWQGREGYDGMKVDLENMTFTGGVKTAAGKNRVVPIHSGIVELVQGMQRTTEDGDQIVFLCGKGQSQFRRDMKTALEKIGVRPLTPHSCRHTFHRLLERAGVNEADRKRLMGHSLKGDITNGTYGHRGVEELRTEIEKIEVLNLDVAA